MKKTTTSLLFLILTPATPGHSDSFSGLIFNDSRLEISEKIVRHLTTRWHFGPHTPSKNLEIEDVAQGPGTEKLIFNYGNKPIYAYQIPKARLKAQELVDLSNAIYIKIVKTDIKNKKKMLKRISALSKKTTGVTP